MDLMYVGLALLFAAALLGLIELCAKLEARR